MRKVVLYLGSSSSGKTHALRHEIAQCRENVLVLGGKAADEFADLMNDHRVTAVTRCVDFLKVLSEGHVENVVVDDPQSISDWQDYEGRFASALEKFHGRLFVSSQMASLFGPLGVVVKGAIKVTVITVTQN